MTNGVAETLVGVLIRENTFTISDPYIRRPKTSNRRCQLALKISKLTVSGNYNRLKLSAVLDVNCSVNTDKEEIFICGCTYIFLSLLCGYIRRV